MSYLCDLFFTPNLIFIVKQTVPFCTFFKISPTTFRWWRRWRKPIVFKKQTFYLMVLRSIYLIFCPFQPGIAYKSVLHKKKACSMNIYKPLKQFISEFTCLWFWTTSKRAKFLFRSTVIQICTFSLFIATFRYFATIFDFLTVRQSIFVRLPYLGVYWTWRFLFGPLSILSQWF